MPLFHPEIRMHIGLLLKHEVGALNSSSAGGTEQVFLDDIRHFRARGFIPHAYARFALPSHGVHPLPFLGTLLSLARRFNTSHHKRQQVFRTLCLLCSEAYYTWQFARKNRHIPVIGYSTPLLGLFHADAIVMFHNAQYRFLLPRFFSRLYRRTRYVFCSSFLLASYRKRYPTLLTEKNTVVLYNAVDTNRFTPEYRARRIQQLTFLFAGAWAKEKGIDILLAAWKRLGNTHHATLTIAAHPSTWYEEFPQQQTAFINTMRRQLKGQKNITLLNGVPHAAMPLLYRRHAFTVVPSVWDEPFGMVALESIAAGTPVIAFRTGGIPEVVSRKNSLLIDPTETALFNALQSIVKSNLPFRKPVKLAKKNIPMRIPYRMATLAALLRKPPPK